MEWYLVIVHSPVKIAQYLTCQLPQKNEAVVPLSTSRAQQTYNIPHHFLTSQFLIKNHIKALATPVLIGYPRTRSVHKAN